MVLFVIQMTTFMVMMYKMKRKNYYEYQKRKFHFFSYFFIFILYQLIHMTQGYADYKYIDYILTPHKDQTIN